MNLGICSHCGGSVEIINLDLNLGECCAGLKQYAKKEKKKYYIPHFSKKGAEANKRKLSMYGNFKLKGYCESCGSSQYPLSRSHILRAGKWKYLEDDAENIIEECYGSHERCHNIWDDGTPDQKKLLNTFDKKVAYMIKHKARKELTDLGIITNKSTFV